MEGTSVDTGRGITDADVVDAVGAAIAALLVLMNRPGAVSAGELADLLEYSAAQLSGQFPGRAKIMTDLASVIRLA